MRRIGRRLCDSWSGSTPPRRRFSSGESRVRDDFSSHWNRGSNDSEKSSLTLDLLLAPFPERGAHFAFERLASRVARKFVHQDHAVEPLVFGGHAGIDPFLQLVGAHAVLFPQ